jgi:hypothetical protein
MYIYQEKENFEELITRVADENSELSYELVANIGRNDI